MKELNPNHPVVVEMREQWHKFCGILMHKHGLTTFEVTEADIEAFSEAIGPDGAVVVDTRGGRLILRLVDRNEAIRLSKTEGGLPM